MTVPDTDQEREDIEVTKSIATCPECGDLLIADFLDIDCETGLGLAASMTIQCKSEDFEDRDTWHRHWQSEWMPVIDAVRGWLIRSKLAIDE